MAKRAPRLTRRQRRGETRADLDERRSATGGARAYAPRGVMAGSGFLPPCHGHGPRCGCGAPMVQVTRTLSDTLGGGMAAMLIEQIVGRNPPPNGETELSPDGRFLRWCDARGELHTIDLSTIEGGTFDDDDDDEEEDDGEIDFDDDESAA